MRILKRIIPKTCKIIITQLIRIRLACYEITERTHPIRPPIRTSTPADGVEREDTIIQTHADEFVSRVCRAVAVLRGVVLCSMRLYGVRVS